MTHRCIGSIALIIAMVILSGVWGPPQAEDKELSLGYLAVTEVEGGNLQVLARCVETRRVLEEIAKHTGAPVVFDTPCNTYVSQLDSQQLFTPDKWMGLIASRGAELSCLKKEDGKWHIYQISIKPSYDASLSETEIVSQFKTDISPTPPESGGNEKGLVFFHGKMIPPPYLLSTEKTTDAQHININNVTVTNMKFPQINSANPEVPKLPLDGQFTSWASLGRYISLYLYFQLLKDNSPKAALSKVKEFLAQQKRVIEIVDDENRGLLIDFQGIYSPMPIRAGVFPFEYNFEKGTNEFPMQLQPNYEKTISNKVEDINLALNGDSMLFLGRRAKVSFSSIDQIQLFASTIKKLKHLSVLQSECLFSEIVTDRLVARELAVNLDDAVLSKVKTVLLRKKKALTP